MPLFSKRSLSLCLLAAVPLFSEAQTLNPNDSSTELTSIAVTAKKLDAARNSLSPSIGSSQFTFDQSDLEALPLGASTPLNQVLLQAPGVVQDAYGQLHIRGDHANVQYRIDGVMIPEPITGFGPALDTRFANQIELLTGALPAQYGYRTAGVINITTQGLESEPGGEVGAVFGTVKHQELNGTLGGGEAGWHYFVSASALQNNLGIENPTASKYPLHDHTVQDKEFGYLSYVIDPTSRLSFVAGYSESSFQIPNLPGQVPAFKLRNSGPLASAFLNANQNELNQFEVMTYQRTRWGDWDFQASLFHRRSEVNYAPDPVGDLTYFGIASQIHLQDEVIGTQIDSRYALNQHHTFRAGLFAQRDQMRINNNSAVFPADVNGHQTSLVPMSVVDNASVNGYLAGVYLQDEWKLRPELTLNYGVRYDQVNTVTHEQQWSPRLGAVYDFTESTRLHAGFARYFTPPPTEKISTTSVALFANTTNALPSDANTTVKAERSNYFDIGISSVLLPHLTVGLDAYGREVKNLQDEGQFGNALIYSAFNYAQGKVTGIELTAHYHQKDFSAYANLSRSQAMGKNVSTGQFNFSSEKLAFISQNWVYLDHDQSVTGSGGISYKKSGVSYFLDAIFGTGLRNGFANTGHLPAYTQVNLALANPWESRFLGKLDTRVSVLNAFDRVYQLRDGSGIGLGAPQFGQRRTLYLSLSRSFSS
jgi:outer membrane receptor protein involved in Fe transport